MHIINRRIFKAFKNEISSSWKFSKKFNTIYERANYGTSNIFLIQVNKATRTIIYIPIRYYSRFPKTPDLIYVPRITRWLLNKVRFKILQKMWDPDFSEGAFIYGSTRAVCKITEIIYNDNPEDLKNLVTISVMLKLTDDMAIRLTKTQKSMIKLKPEDIKMLIPVAVHLNKEGLHKNCRIGMRVLALKWLKNPKGPLNLVLVAIQTEFLRDYSARVQPEWTISAFDILECTMLTETIEQ